MSGQALPGENEPAGRDPVDSTGQYVRVIVHDDRRGDRHPLQHGLAVVRMAEIDGIDVENGKALARSPSCNTRAYLCISGEVLPVSISTYCPRQLPSGNTFSYLHQT